MSDRRQLHLNLFVHDVGAHEAAWRLPESDPLAAKKVEHFINAARLAEAGKLDSVFFADSPVLFGNPTHRPVTSLEPTTLLGALAVNTTHIGLITTASTTYAEPYDLARRFASLDHISGGRMGWNIVTSTTDAAARNFGLDKQPSHRDRYARADDFLDVATKLWDSWEDDAEIADKETGDFADMSKIHEINHDGPFFRVAGPLNLPRSPQAYPVLVQAGSSEDGREFAGRWAEVAFTAQPRFEEAQQFYADLKARARAAGRSDDEITVLPGLAPTIGSTEAEARARANELEDRMVPGFGLSQLSNIFGVDLMGAELDAPLPDVPAEDEIEGQKSRATLVASLARRDNLTVRQLIARLGSGRGHKTFVGTPEQLVDDLEVWFHGRAADGFNVLPPTIPADLEVFVEQVIPILQERGLFRKEYTGATLREHYGLARPANRLTTSLGAAAGA